MTDLQSKAFSTRAVHAGERTKQADYTPVTTSIVPSVGYLYESMDDLDAVFANRKPGYVYARYGSPTVGIAGPAKQPSRPRVALTVRPNPARTGTAISFQFTANSPAQVTVYDAAGRRVRSIAVPQSPAANRCSLSWDCRGVSVPPGVYICRLTTVGGSATQKLVMTE